MVRSGGRGVPQSSESVEYQVRHPLCRVGLLYRDPGVAVGSTLISGESIAKDGGVWAGMSEFLGSFCERIGVRGACGG